jgi:hypothetical protein
MAAGKAAERFGEGRGPGPDRFAREPAVEVGMEFPGVGVAVAGSGLQALGENHGQGACIPRAACRAESPAKRPGIRDRSPADNRGGFQERAAAEFIGQLTEEEFVEHKPEGVDIAALVDGSIVESRLFGAHVADGAEQFARLGRGGRGVGISGQQPGDSEVDHTHTAGRIDENVSRLQIAMDDA